MAPNELAEGQAHLWLGRLDEPADASRLSWLSADELARAGRLIMPAAGERFAAGRARLRELLSRYTGTPPGEILLLTGEHGRPALAGGEIEFNLAHSGDWVLFAFTRSARIGVDLESPHPVPELEAIARAYFSPTERAALLALPEAEQLEAFFRAWTRKEAYLKARGSGMALALDRFSVTLRPGEPPALLEVAGEPEEASRWRLTHLEPRPGLIGALAADRELEIVWVGSSSQPSAVSIQQK